MIKNLTKKKKLVSKARILKSELLKAIGLMFSRKIKDKGLVFVFKYENIIPLHMFFVFYPIDVLFLDKDKKVVDMKERFMPFTLFNNRRKAMYVIELPSGVIMKTGTQLGDKVSF